jgi:Ca2+-transporting ATPase
MPLNHPIWTLTAEDVYRSLGTSAQGLTDDDAAVKLKQYGFNELPEQALRPLVLVVGGRHSGIHRQYT